MSNESHPPRRVVLDEKGIAGVLGVSVSFVRKDRHGKRLLPFFRVGDLIRYDVERVLAALLASEEGGPPRATRKRADGKLVVASNLVAADTAPSEPAPKRRGRPRKNTAPVLPA